MTATVPDGRHPSDAVGEAHPSFRDPCLEQRFRDDGYVVFDLFGPAEVADLRRRLDELYVGETEDACHRSNESADLAYRRGLHLLITTALDPVAERLLLDHRTFSSGALVKWKGPNSAMPAHQDWTMVDEGRFRSLSFWIPLCDVGVANGAISLVPGSHRILSGMRPNPGAPPSYADPTGGIDPLAMRSVPMQAGSCLVFDHGVLHGSPPNTTDEPRPSLVLAATPRAATLQHLWRRPEDDVVERYEVADPEFFRHCTPEVRPDHPAITLVETLPFRPHEDHARAWLADRVAPSGAAIAKPEPTGELVEPAGSGARQARFGRGLRRRRRAGR